MNEITKQFNGRAAESKSLRQKTGITTKEVVSIGMFAAVLAVLSQIAIPMPSGVPITLQTFAVALTGVVLSWKLGTASMLVYILLGAIGVPVFSELSGGFRVLVSYTGGFIWGFIVMTLLCGAGILLKNKVLGVTFGFAGLVICHLFGVVQFMLVMNMGFMESFLLASAPYLIKDALSVILAFVIGAQIRARLLKAGLL